MGLTSANARGAARKITLSAPSGSESIASEWREVTARCCHQTTPASATATANVNKRVPVLS